jgi:hypothetical protein
MSVLPIVTPPREGDILQFSPGELLVWKGTLADTGSFDQFELTAQPGHPGAPEHVHIAVEECFSVLDGAFRFTVAGEIVLAEAGAFLFVPTPAGPELAAAPPAPAPAARPAHRPGGPRPPRRRAGPPGR